MQYYITLLFWMLFQCTINEKSTFTNTDNLPYFGYHPDNFNVSTINKEVIHPVQKLSETTDHSLSAHSSENPLHNPSGYITKTRKEIIPVTQVLVPSV